MVDINVKLNFNLIENAKHTKMYCGLNYKIKKEIKKKKKRIKEEKKIIIDY